jgi:hypothetical protein
MVRRDTQPKHRHSFAGFDAGSPLLGLPEESDHSTWPMNLPHTRAAALTAVTYWTKSEESDDEYIRVASNNRRDVLAKGVRVDGDCFGVRPAGGLLGLTISFRADCLELALALAADFCRAAHAFGARPLGDAASLRRHSLENLELHRVDVT